MRTGPTLTEEGVSQGSLGSQPPPWIKSEHLLNEILCLWIRVTLLHDITKGPGREECKISSEHRRLFRPLLLAGGAQVLEDLGQLVSVVVAGEERLLGDDLSEDAATAPDIHWGGV